MTAWCHVALYGTDTRISSERHRDVWIHVICIMVCAELLQTVAATVCDNPDTLISPFCVVWNLSYSVNRATLLIMCLITHTVSYNNMQCTWRVSVSRCRVYLSMLHFHHWTQLTHITHSRNWVISLSSGSSEEQAALIRSCQSLTDDPVHSVLTVHNVLGSDDADV